MLLNLEATQDIDFLKMKAAVLTKDQKFPHTAAKKLKEILMDDQIQAEEFSKEFNKILLSTEKLNWKILVYLGDIKDRFIDQMNHISWGPIVFMTFLIIFLFFIYKKFKLKKRFNFVYKISSDLLERLIALAGYYVPLGTIYANYVRDFLLPRYPSLSLITPDIMRFAMSYYPKHMLLVNYGYFFGILILCLRYKLPKPRFVRFHLIRGLMLFAFQSLPDMFLSIFFTSPIITVTQQSNYALLLFAINLSWILPGLVQAITHTYPKNGLVRDAVEIQLGRDKDDGFKWWDRQ